MANVAISLDALDSDKTEVIFDVELEEQVQEAIRKGIIDTLENANFQPHAFLVSKVEEIWKDSPPLAFELCAKGAARLALGLSNETATVSFNNAT